MYPNLSERESATAELMESPMSVSVVLPFEPKMSSKNDIEFTLRSASRKVEKELLSEFSVAEATPVIRKLQGAFRNLNYTTHKKSIAVFVSPLVEKVFYMDIPVEEKIVVNEPFRIRDLVNCRKKKVEFLVLLLSARQSKMYWSDGTHLKLIKSNIHFSDTPGPKEVVLDKFLHHMDEGLSLVLKAYPLPVFVLGAVRTVGHFSAFTHHSKNIAGYIHKDCIEAGENELLDLLQPYLGDWQQVRQNSSLRLAQRAKEAGKLVCGMQAVRKSARFSNSRLLIVERNYSYPENQTAMGNIVEDQNPRPDFYIGDCVDAIMQKVLENGGDVEWVDKDSLKDYGHIALIQYY